jgi:pentatricopeptide repeat protein
MELMKITPDEKTYNYMIKAAAQTGNVTVAEEYHQ